MRFPLIEDAEEVQRAGIRRCAAMGVFAATVIGAAVTQGTVASVSARVDPVRSAPASHFSAYSALPVGQEPSLQKRTSAGRSRFFNEAPTNFDHWTRPPTGTCVPHYRRYYAMRLYPPFADDCVLAGYTGGLGYQDVQAIYKDEAGNPEYPQWVLKDSAGRNLYVPFACEAGTCPQYAADIGNQDFRDWYITTAQGWLPLGYRGIFADDVNWNLNVSDGNGNLVRPIDPRTDNAMTRRDWKRYLTQFLKQISLAFPEKEVMINSVWWRPESDLDNRVVRRGVQKGTHFEIERGTKDVFDGQSWPALLSYIDRLHAMGVGVNLDNYYAESREQAEFEMAAYFLISTGRDSFSAEYRSCPDAIPPSPCPKRWWDGYDTDLGRPAGQRVVRPNGVYQRTFADGLVLVNPPRAATQKVRLDGTYWTLDGVAVTRVTLLGGRAVVLTR